MADAMATIVNMLVVLGVAVGGIIIIGLIWQLNKRRERKKLDLLDREGEIEIERKDKEVRLGRRWLILCFQVFVFSGVSALLILKWAIAWTEYYPNRGFWLALMVTYLVVVDGGGFGIWLGLALGRVMTYKAFETVTKYPDGTHKLHQWFVTNPVQLTRGNVEVNSIENPIIQKYMRKLDQDVEDATLFSVGGNQLFATLFTTFQFDSDLVVILTRHPNDKAWQRRKARIYAMSMPLNSDTARTKFRYVGMTTLVIGDPDRQLKLKQVPMLFAPTDDQDDVDAQFILNKKLKDIEAEEIIDAQICAVSPSAHALKDELGRVKANAKRLIDNAHLREQQRNEENDQMVRLALKKGKHEAPIAKNYLVWFCIILMLAVLATAFLARYMWTPNYTGGNNETGGAAKWLLERLAQQMKSFRR